MADLSYWEPNFSFAGVGEFGQRFETEALDTDSMEPQLDCRQQLYSCLDCEQHWYIECLPEEQASVGFALKYAEAKPITDEDLRCQKEFLSILAHKGFAPELCRKGDCPNFSLAGRAFCHLHISFP